MSYSNKLKAALNAARRQKAELEADRHIVRQLVRSLVKQGLNPADYLVDIRTEGNRRVATLRPKSNPAVPQEKPQ